MSREIDQRWYHDWKECETDAPFDSSERLTAPEGFEKLIAPYSEYCKKKSLLNVLEGLEGYTPRTNCGGVFIEKVLFIKSVNMKILLDSINLSGFF